MNSPQRAEAAARPTPSVSSAVITAIVIAAFSIFLYSNLFLFPAVPIARVGDESVYILNGVQVAEGKVLYREVFTFLTPGIGALYGSLFRVFGVQNWIPPALFVCIGAAMGAVTFGISRHLIRGWHALLPACIFVVVLFPSNADDSHHYLAVLAVLAAVLVLLKNGAGRVVLAGVLCGIGAWFNQVHGTMGLVAIAAFQFWRPAAGTGGQSPIRRVSLLAAAAAGSFAIASGAFIVQAGVRDFFWHTVTFVVRHYPAYGPSNTLQTYMADPPVITRWYHAVRLGIWLSVHALVPFMYVLFVARYWNRLRRAAGHDEAERLRNAVLVCVVGLGLFAGAVPAPSAFRLSVIAAPALVLAVWMAVESGGLAARVALLLAWLLVFALAVTQPARTQRAAAFATLEPHSGGRVALSQDLVPQFEWLKQHTRPEDYVWQPCPCQVRVYPFAGLRNPTATVVAWYGGFTQPQLERSIIDDLERHRARYILWSREMDSAPPADESLRALRNYVAAHYQHDPSYPDPAVYALRRNVP